MTVPQYFVNRQLYVQIDNTNW